MVYTTDKGVVAIKIVSALITELDARLPGLGEALQARLNSDEKPTDTPDWADRDEAARIVSELTS